MKKVFIFYASILIFFSFSFPKNRITLEPYKSSYISLQEVKLQHLKDLEHLSLMLNDFRKLVDVKNLLELKKQLREIRLQYKKTESFICYYSSDEAKFFLNSAISCMCIFNCIMQKTGCYGCAIQFKFS